MNETVRYVLEFFFENNAHLAKLILLVFASFVTFHIRLERGGNDDQERNDE